MYSCRILTDDNRMKVVLYIAFFHEISDELIVQAMKYACVQIAKYSGTLLEDGTHVARTFFKRQNMKFFHRKRKQLVMHPCFTKNSWIVMKNIDMFKMNITFRNLKNFS